MVRRGTFTGWRIHFLTGLGLVPFSWTTFRRKESPNLAQSLNHAHCRTVLSFFQIILPADDLLLKFFQSRPPHPTQIISSDLSSPPICPKELPIPFLNGFGTSGSLPAGPSPPRQTCCQWGGGGGNFTIFLCSQQKRSGPGPETSRGQPFREKGKESPNLVVVTVRVSIT